MTFQLHLSIKLMVKILLNENTTDKIPSKCWHAMALMLKMISIITVYLYYISMVPCIGLLLTIIAVFIVVVIGPFIDA